VKPLRSGGGDGVAVPGDLLFSAQHLVFSRICLPYVTFILEKLRTEVDVGVLVLDDGMRSRFGCRDPVDQDLSASVVGDVGRR